MPHDRHDILRDLQAAVTELQLFTSGVSLQAYGQDRQLQLAVERLFTIIGEAMTRLRIVSAESLADIKEYRQIIAFRNLLVHGYDTVADEVVWQIIQDDVPVLLADVNAMLGGAEE